MTMSHTDAELLLEAAVLGVLPAAEQRAVLAHVTSCDVCGREWRSLEATMGAIAHAAPPVAGDGRQTRERLLARASASKGARITSALPAQGKTAGARSGRQLPASFFGFGALVLAATLALLVRERVEGDRLREALSLADRTYLAQLDTLRGTVAEREQQMASLVGAQVRVVELASTGPVKPSAKMFWDQATDRWTFVAHALPALEAGRTYQLWLVTADQKISAGTFTPDAKGDAVVRATYPLDPAALRAVAVTEEVAGGVPEPTGPVVVAGTAGR